VASLGQIPTPERGRLVERADLALDERQVVQGIEDQILTLVGSLVAGEGLGGAADHDPVDISSGQHLAMAIGQPTITYRQLIDGLQPQGALPALTG
jgi:hypothetical protein